MPRCDESEIGEFKRSQRVGIQIPAHEWRAIASTCARCKYGKRIGISGRGRKVPTFFVAADSSIPLPVPCGNPALALGREDSENGCGGEAMQTQVKVRLTLAD